MAASNGEIKAMKLLLSLGASVHIRSVYNGTALHYAASNGHSEACRLLLAHCANPSAFAEWGGTPLEWAMERHQLPGSAGVIRLLAPLTDEEAQLGLDHPRPWLGPWHTQGWFRRGLNKSMALVPGHTWRLNRKQSAHPLNEDPSALDPRAIARAKSKELHTMQALASKQRQRGDPVMPSRPVADGSLLMGTPGAAGLRIGEYVDGSGGVDLALLDEGWQRRAWRFEQHASYRSPTPAADGSTSAKPRVRKLME